MPITIGSNIGSLKAQRRLAEATTSLSSTYERLSSGQRINKASDDAAGLAISSALNSRAQVYSQALRNANDGISLYSIADATVSSLSDINTRLQELGEQAANGVYSTAQRKAIDSEAQALSKEYFRISRAAQFNGQRLFDGSMNQGLRLQLGYGLSSSIQSSVGGKLGTGSLTAFVTLATQGSLATGNAIGDLNGDGILDLVTSGDAGVTVSLGNGDGTFRAPSSFADTSSLTASIALKDLNGDGVLDIVTLGVTNTGGFPSISQGELGIRFGNGDGTFGARSSYVIASDPSLLGFSSSSLAFGDLNGDGNLDIVTAGYYGSGVGFAKVQLGTGGGRLSSVSTYNMGIGARAAALGDLNGDGILDVVTGGQAGITYRLGTGGGSFDTSKSFTLTTFGAGAGVSSLALGDLNGDGILDLVASSYDAQPLVSVSIGNGTGGFASATTFSTLDAYVRKIRLADLNGDGLLDVVTTGIDPSGLPSVSTLLNTGNGILSTGNSVNPFDQTTPADSPPLGLEIGDVNGDGVLDVIATGTSYSPSEIGQTGVLLGQTRDGISPLQPFSLTSRADALQALGLFSRTARNLSDIRGNLGATQSRLTVAMNGLSSARENFVAASSRILDADIAQESAQLGRTQILQQAGAAVLAQANLAPQLALRLLR